jgi:hypothetical protein
MRGYSYRLCSSNFNFFLLIYHNRQNSLSRSVPASALGGFPQLGQNIPHLGGARVHQGVSE